MRCAVATALLGSWLGAAGAALAAPGLESTAGSVEPTEGAAPRDVRPVFLVTEVFVEGQGAANDGLRDALSARFGRLRHKLDVRSVGELKKALDHAALLQLLGEETEHVSRLGSYVDADRIVFGRVTNIGGVREVSVRVVDVQEGSVEVAMARRIASDVDDAMLLAVVDSLADRLAAWALTTYGDSTPSSTYAQLAEQRVPRRDGPERRRRAAPSPWSTLGLGGALVAGAGLGLLGGAGAMWAADVPVDEGVALSCAIGGGLSLIAGTALVVVDRGE